MYSLVPLGISVPLVGKDRCKVKQRNRTTFLYEQKKESFVTVAALWRTAGHLEVLMHHVRGRSVSQTSANLLWQELLPALCP